MKPRIAFFSVLICVAAVVAVTRENPARAADKDCADFSTQAQAQQYFISKGGPSQDPDRLDGDGDGIACEDLPCPCVTGAGGGGSGGGGGEGGQTCGVERWAVKTLSDSRVGRVNFRPRRTTVNALRAKPAPGVGTDTPRIRGVETTTYKLRARLIEFAAEDDRDIHLVISAPGDPSKTMIVEFPDPTCPGARSSPKRKKMGQARAAMTRACGRASSSFHDLAGFATIRGVGFFDLKHGQNGVAPNAIELHPVLGFSSSTCRQP